MSISIAIPEVYRSIVDGVPSPSFIALEHAALQSRAPETLIALALSQGDEVAVVCSSTSRIPFVLQRWGLEAKRKRFGSLFLLTVSGSSLWVLDQFEDIPFSVNALHGLYVFDAHRLRSNPVDRLSPYLAPNSPVVVAGEMCERYHWFYSWARRPDVTLHRVPARDIVRQFPDQRKVLETSRLGMEEGQAKRVFDLLDVEPRVSPFTRFAMARLKVRTDKGPEFLSPTQIEEARRSLGEGWSSGRAGLPLVSFEVSQLQRRYLAMKRLGHRQGFSKFLLLKYRRGGFTTIEQGLSYYHTAMRRQSYVATLAHTRDSTQRIFRIASMFHENDPFAPRRVNDSKTSLELANGSLFFIGTAGGHAFSRGDTLQRVHGSEVAYWKEGPNQEQDQELLIAGLTEAASHGEVVLETTPNGNEWFRFRYREAKQGQIDWFPIFLPWYLDPTNVARPGTYDPQEIADTLSDEERELSRRHGLTIAQIAFRRMKKTGLKRLFMQEYPEDDEECFLSSGTCFFDVPVLSDLHKTLPDKRLAPVYRELKGGYWVEWEEPRPNVEYVLGADTSEGIPGCDLNGCGVMRRDTGLQVAATHGLFSIPDQADLIIRMSERYNGAVIGVERNNHGHAVLQRIIDSGYGKPHFRGGPLFYYSRHVRETLEGRKAKGRPGWDTTPVTRPQMLSDLAEMLEQPGWVRDVDFVAECMSFTLQSNGKFEGVPHDDTVMKWAIAVQMRRHRRIKPKLTVLEGVS